MDDLNERNRRIITVAVVVHVIVATLTWRDLRRRPRELVRGPKRLWRVASSLNTTGSVAYWVLGRRRAAKG